MNVSAVSSAAASNAALLAAAVRVPASAAIAAQTESSGQIQGQILQLQQQEQGNPSEKISEEIQVLEQARTLQLKQGPSGLNASA